MGKTSEKDRLPGPSSITTQEKSDLFTKKTYSALSKQQKTYLTNFFQLKTKNEQLSIDRLALLSKEDLAKSSGEDSGLDELVDAFAHRKFLNQSLAHHSDYVNSINSISLQYYSAIERAATKDALYLAYHVLYTQYLIDVTEHEANSPKAHAALKKLNHCVRLINKIDELEARDTNNAIEHKQNDLIRTTSQTVLPKTTSIIKVLSYAGWERINQLWQRVSLGSIGSANKTIKPNDDYATQLDQVVIPAGAISYGYYGIRGGTALYVKAKHSIKPNWFSRRFMNDLEYAVKNRLQERIAIRKTQPIHNIDLPDEADIIDPYDEEYKWLLRNDAFWGLGNLALRLDEYINGIGGPLQGLPDGIVSCILLLYDGCAAIAQMKEGFEKKNAKIAEYDKEIKVLERIDAVNRSEKESKDLQDLIDAREACEKNWRSDRWGYLLTISYSGVLLIGYSMIVAFSQMGQSVLPGGLLCLAITFVVTISKEMITIQKMSNEIKELNTQLGALEQRLADIETIATQSTLTDEQLIEKNKLILDIAMIEKKIDNKHTIYDRQLYKSAINIFVAMAIPVFVATMIFASPILGPAVGGVALLTIAMWVIAYTLPMIVKMALERSSYFTPEELIIADIKEDDLKIAEGEYAVINPDDEELPLLAQTSST